MLNCGFKGAAPTCMTANSHDVKVASLKDRSITAVQVVCSYYHQQVYAGNVFGDGRGTNARLFLPTSMFLTPATIYPKGLRSIVKTFNARDLMAFSSDVFSGANIRQIQGVETRFIFPKLRLVFPKR